MAGQDPRYRGPEKGKDAKRTYSIKADTVKMSWSCYKNSWRATTKESFLLRISGRKALSRISIFRLTPGSRLPRIEQSALPQQKRNSSETYPKLCHQKQATENPKITTALKKSVIDCWGWG